MSRHEAFALDFLEPSPPPPAPPRSERGPVFTYASPEQPLWRQAVIRLVERLSGRARFERIYEAWRRGPRDRQAPIFSEAVRALGIRADVTAGDMALIPARGPLLVVANHPYGILDGLLIGHLVATRRRDIKLICHSRLCQPPEAQAALLPVDFRDTPEARRVSAETRRQAVDWLDQGHVIILFPAGGVATSVSPWRGAAADFAWHPFTLRLARRAGVRTLVLHVHGQNSRLFQWVSHVSYPLRVALIFRETARALRRPVRVSIAPPLALSEIDAADRLVALRERCFAMAGEGGADAAAVFEFPGHIRF
jgi:putative hemolysin